MLTDEQKEYILKKIGKRIVTKAEHIANLAYQILEDVIMLWDIPFDIFEEAFEDPSK